MGGFYPRLPELQVQMGVGEGTLGLAIMGVAAGMLVSLTFFVPQLERMRSRTVLLTTLPVISTAFARRRGSPPPAVRGSRRLGLRGAYPRRYPRKYLYEVGTVQQWRSRR